MAARPPRAASAASGNESARCGDGGPEGSDIGHVGRPFENRGGDVGTATSAWTRSDRAAATTGAAAGRAAASASSATATTDVAIREEGSGSA